MFELYIREDPPCGWCTAAKKLLEENNLDFSSHVVGKDLSKEKLREIFPNAKTYPIIMYNNMCLGGYEELKSTILSLQLEGKV